jgi:hypothetical protein
MPDLKTETDQQQTKGGESLLRFKNPDYVHTNIQNGKRKPWKTLKQVLSQEQNTVWSSEAITYSSLDAPPSFTPAKKYSDLSGLETTYTDPQTKLNYATAEEFQEIRRMPSDLIQGYLTLRKANSMLQ